MVQESEEREILIAEASATLAEFEAPGLEAIVAGLQEIVEQFAEQMESFTKFAERVASQLSGVFEATANLVQVAHRAYRETFSARFEALPSAETGSRLAALKRKAEQQLAMAMLVTSRRARQNHSIKRIQTLFLVAQPNGPNLPVMRTSAAGLTSFA